MYTPLLHSSIATTSSWQPRRKRQQRQPKGASKRSEQIIRSLCLTLSVSHYVNQQGSKSIQCPLR